MQESGLFLDIVTNIVGILIILVMVIGARVQSISLKPRGQRPNLGDLMMEVVRLEDAVVASESELVDLDEQGDNSLSPWQMLEMQNSFGDGCFSNKTRS